MGHKAGDNNQVLALAEALGWPHEIKRMSYRKSELLSNLLLGPTLAGIRRGASSPLEPPWPELIITAGRRNEPVARWIRRQARGAGVTARIVHIGRPWAPLAEFDLIVTTPQYCLPRAGNILHNTFPLHRVTPQRLAEAAASWEARLSHLPRPYTALLIGGNSGPFTLNEPKSLALARAADELAGQSGEGALLVTTSARTPAGTLPLLRDAITAPAFFHDWQPGGEDNPYYAFLALADAFIVTGDSVSMVCEACGTGKPVYIFDLADAPRAHRPDAPGDKLPWWRYGHNFRWRPLSHRLAMRLGPERMRRDVNRLHETLVRLGHAAWLGSPVAGGGASPRDELPETVRRVEALFCGGRPASGHIR